MIDERFSAAAFARAGWGSDKARSLSIELQNEILWRIHSLAAPEMIEIVKTLNELGHNLDVYSEGVGEFHYRDLSPEIGFEYKLLVALDLVVSVGYPYTVQPDDLE